MTRTFWLRLAIVLLAGAVLGAKPASPHERAVEVLVALARAGGKFQDPLPADGVEEKMIRIAGDGADVKARLYLPEKPGGHGIVLAHGVHYRGIDEPRFVRFAREVAKVGITVLTPEMRDLADYRITPSGVTTIADCVGYLGDRTDLVPEGKVGLIGISFGGGLSLVAAARPKVSERLLYVASVGGHHDLARVLRFFLTNTIRTPDGRTKLEAHEYGLVVAVYGRLDDLAPPADLERVRRVFRAWLREDRPRARKLAEGLATERGRELFRLLDEQRLAELRPEIEAWIASHGGDLAAVSPRGKLHEIPVPIYLLHGKNDRVIPPSELAWARTELDGHVHRALVSGLLDHVTPDRPAGFFERLMLVDFMAEML